MWVNANGKSKKNMTRQVIEIKSHSYTKLAFFCRRTRRIKNNKMERDNILHSLLMSRRSCIIGTKRLSRSLWLHTSDDFLVERNGKKVFTNASIAYAMPVYCNRGYVRSQSMRRIIECSTIGVECAISNNTRCERVDTEFHKVGISHCSHVIDSGMYALPTDGTQSRQFARNFSWFRNYVKAPSELRVAFGGVFDGVTHSCHDIKSFSSIFIWLQLDERTVCSRQVLVVHTILAQIDWICRLVTFHETTDTRKEEMCASRKKNINSFGEIDNDYLCLWMVVWRQLNCVHCALPHWLWVPGKT